MNSRNTLISHNESCDVGLLLIVFTYISYYIMLYRYYFEMIHLF